MLDGEVVVEVLVDAALVGGLPTASKEVFEDVPEDEDRDHEGHGSDEVPFDTWVFLEGVDIHAEEADDESEREKDWQKLSALCQRRWSRWVGY